MTATIDDPLICPQITVGPIVDPCPNVTINHDYFGLGNGVFVIDCGEGYTCLGFDVERRKTTEVLHWLFEQGVQRLPKLRAERGTIWAYAEYQRAMKLGREYSARTGVKCPAELTPQLANLVGKWVEVVDCHNETRRFRVGKSTGWMPCHLEIETPWADGGGAVTGAPFKSVKEIPQPKFVRTRNYPRV